MSVMLGILNWYQIANLFNVFLFQASARSSMIFAPTIVFRSPTLKLAWDNSRFHEYLQSRRYPGVPVDLMFAFVNLSVCPNCCAETWERTSCSIPTASASLIVWTALDEGLAIGMLPAERAARRCRLFSGSAEFLSLWLTVQSVSVAVP